MTRVLAAVVSLILLAVPIGSSSAEEGAGLQLVLGVTSEGRATDQWLAMLRKRLPDPEYSELATSVKELSDEERKWAELIGAKAADWERRRDGLASPFAPIEPPAHVVIVMGNRGGQDAFTHDAATIGFDLSALYSVYGDALLPDNTGRINRFFDHEYTHLLQKGWLADHHPYDGSSPLRAALLDIWLEGLGHHHSLSDRWRATGGMHSKAAREALTVLEPRFAARLAALACASWETAGPLLEDLSQGRFEAKWGALPAALWLEAEASGDRGALRRFVQAGPDGVWELAARHLPDPLGKVVTEARRSAAVCSQTGDEGHAGRRVPGS